MCLMFVEGLTNNNNNNINSFVPAARWRQRRRDAFKSFHSSLVRLHEIIIKDNNKRKALISTRSLFPLSATFARQQNNSKLKIIDYSFRVQHFFFSFGTIRRGQWGLMMSNEIGFSFGDGEGDCWTVSSIIKPPAHIIGQISYRISIMTNILGTSGLWWT